MSRRRFLVASSAVAFVGAGASGASGKGIANLQRVRSVSRALGAEVSMIALHPERDAAESALAAAFTELERIESVMSLYRPESQISRLNREGVLDVPDERLVRVLKHAADISRQSEGAFDVSVQPLWATHHAAQELGRLPSVEELKAARTMVGWEGVEVSSDRIRLRKRGAAITLNGIAQGFAADSAMAILRKHGIKHALIDTGEFSSTGGNLESSKWSVGIRHPRKKEALAEVAKLDGRCLATSGDYATPFSDDLMHHHLFDPATGESPAEFSSVSVVARTAMEADALSTAVFVLGANKGAKLIRETKGADALVIFKDGRQFATDGFPVSA